MYGGDAALRRDVQGVALDDELPSAGRERGDVDAAVPPAALHDDVFFELAPGLAQDVGDALDLMASRPTSKYAATIAVVTCIPSGSSDRALTQRRC
ncbi:hypothetical protein ABZ016_31085 [Streptomyces sp. NPDC006372]|uniref:hypothetical protein n=1 Tax=Streptomyces sp. NPDC006372 TaxID=3155599 RepID=UPI0033B92D26